MEKIKIMCQNLQKCGRESFETDIAEGLYI